jgi:hypothetical protein
MHSRPSTSPESYRDETFQTFLEALNHILNSMEVSLTQSLNTVASLRGLADMAVIEMSREGEAHKDN